MAIARTAVPNVFTVGRRPSEATVVVTTGLLDRPDAFSPSSGPFVAGRSIVLGNRGEMRAYWRSQLA